MKVILLLLAVSFASAQLEGDELAINPPECQSSKQISDPANAEKIIGGYEATPNSFPFIGSLQRLSVVGYSHMCGVSLINSRWALTAAHCVQGQPKNFLRLVFGAHDIKTQEPAQKTYSVASFFYHENYDSALIINDIALIKLSAPVIYDKYINPVCLATSNNKFEGRTATNIGWGKYNNNPSGNLPSKLQRVDIPVVNHTRCADWYSEVNPVLEQENICFGTQEGGIGSCNGDSGGPFVVTEQDNVYYQIGIVSWGMIPCAEYPTVATRVSNYINWIQKIITNNPN